MNFIPAFGVQVDLWVYIVVGAVALAMAIGGGYVSMKDRKAAKAKKNARASR